jgi:hypothetical protein
MIKSLESEDERLREKAMNRPSGDQTGLNSPGGIAGTMPLTGFGSLFRITDSVDSPGGWECLAIR